jgi:hypothetical protein
MPSWRRQGKTLYFFCCYYFGLHSVTLPDDGRMTLCTGLERRDLGLDEAVAQHLPTGTNANLSVGNLVPHQRFDVGTSRL